MNMAKIREGYKETEIGVIPEEWEVKRVIDLSDKSDRYSFTGGPFGSDLKSSDYTEKGVRVIQLQNIGDGKFLDNSKVFTSQKKANQLSSCNIFPNEIILAKMADPVARACKIPDYNDRYLMCSDGIRLKVDSGFYNVDFCLYSINSSYFRKKAVENSTGTTRLRIGLTALKELKLAISPLLEQQRIAEILSTTDEHIEKLDKTIEDYKLFKKGMLKKLLTEGIGHAEFKDTEIGRIPKEWKVKQLGDLFSFSGGYPIPRSQLTDEGVLYLHYGDIHTRTSTIISTEIDKRWLPRLERSKVKELDFLKTGDLVFADASEDYEGVGKSIIIINNDNEELVAGLHTIIGKSNVDVLYLHYKRYFLESESTRKQIKKLATGSKVYGISKGNISKIVIPIPPLPEQQQIALTLSELDNRIDLYIHERENYIELKKALMEQLLTGKIRVNQ